MEYVILSLLSISPKTIYEINKSFDQGISLFYSKSYGGIQNGIKKLLQKSLISFTESIDNGRNKKTYSINPSGYKELMRWMLSPIPENKQETNILTKLFFLGLIKDRDKKLEILNNIIKAYHETIEGFERTEATINTYTVPTNYLEIFKYQKQTLSFGLTAARSELKWFLELKKTI